MAQVIKKLKNYLKSVNDRRFLEKFEDRQNLFRVGYNERVRWFEMVGQKERVEALEKGYVRDSGTLDRLFPKYANLIAQYMCLDDNQFAIILQEGYMNALVGYIAHRGTLSTSKVCALIKATISRAGKDAPQPMSEASKQLPNLLYKYIVREGLQESLIDYVMGLLASEDRLRQLVTSAVDVHYHIMAVKAGYNSDKNCVTDGFYTYLSWMEKEKIQMPYEAEIIMNARQLDAFHRCGHHLSKKAIVEFLISRGEYDTIVNSIIANEVLYPAWPELDLALKSNVMIYRKYQLALISDKLQVANS